MNLLNRLHDEGVQFRLRHGELQVKGFERIPLDLQEEISNRKQELLELFESEQEVWIFEHLYVPSQLEAGTVDVWILGRRHDKPAWTFWFVRNEVRSEQEDGK